MATPRRTVRGQLDAAAHKTLGLERLRSGQREALTTLLEGHDVLAVFPSGYGKSAIYQVAGALIPGATVVVSPLIALQQDQVEAMAEQDSGGAVLINSTLGAREREQALQTIGSGAVEFVLLSPEQLANEDTLAHLERAHPSLVVVDEAHCIVSWGHDFRPDYATLGAAIEALGRPRVLALTATAAPPVQDEIVARLDLQSPRIIVRDLDRPNIHLAVQHFNDEASKTSALLEAVQAAEPSGIVYAATRATVELLAADLIGRGLRAASYHAGMPVAQRSDTQSAFMSNDIDVIVATTAFGMGVDKPDIRFVVHYEVSDSLDAYYQEIGRAGRDGEPATATLFYRPEDLGIRRFFVGGAGIDADELEAILDEVPRAKERSLEDIAQRLDLSMPRLLRAVSLLEQTGALVLIDPRTVRGTGVSMTHAAAEQASGQSEQQHRFEKTRVAMMQRYAEQTGCRRAALLTYFGEGYEPPCNNCDNCNAGLRHEPAPSSGEMPVWATPGAEVHHEAFGSGRVLEVNASRIVVLFDDTGYRVLDLEAAGPFLHPR
jgi:ATP-dependent DNA helicase RecQ